MTHPGTIPAANRPKTYGASDLDPVRPTNLGPLHATKCKRLLTRPGPETPVARDLPRAFPLADANGPLLYRQTAKPRHVHGGQDEKEPSLYIRAVRCGF